MRRVLRWEDASDFSPPNGATTISTRLTLDRSGVPVIVPDQQRRASPDALFLRVFQMLTVAYPVLWLIGIAGLYWVVLGLAGAIYVILRGHVARVAVPLVALVLLLLASTPVGIAAFGFDFSRVASLFGNLLVWIAIIALLTLARSHGLVEAVSRGLIVIGLAQGAITFAAQLAYPAVLPVPVLSGLASSLPSGLAAFAVNGLYGPDWLGTVAFRSSGLMAQPTWAGATGAVVVIVGLRTAWVERGVWRLLGLLAVVAGLYSLDLSLSRSTEISLAVAAVVGVVIASRRVSGRLFGVLVAIGVIGVAIVLTGWGKQVGALATSINDAREGSLDARGAIYAKTFEFIQQLPVALIGYGIKPKEEGLVASVATHSSYLGLLFRSGVLGLAALLVFFVVVLALAVRASDGWAGALAVLTLMWCSLEDFDPGHLVPLGIVTAYALVAQRRPDALGVRPGKSLPATSGA